MLPIIEAASVPAPDNVPELVGTIVVMVLTWFLGRKQSKSLS
nr:MAG: hypothetical protein [Microvirus sp.]